MAAPYVNWPAVGVESTAGDDISWLFQVKNVAGNAVDIDGYTFSFFATNQADPDDVIEITNASFSITDGDEGQALFVVARALTMDYVTTGAVFQGEIWRTNSNAQKRLCAGEWRINPTIRP